MAEGVGFEPTVTLSATTAFEAAPFVRSGNLPHLRIVTFNGNAMVQKHIRPCYFDNESPNLDRYFAFLLFKVTVRERFHTIQRCYQMGHGHKSRRIHQVEREGHERSYLPPSTDHTLSVYR